MTHVHRRRLVMTRQFLRCANACSQTARTDAISLLTCFFAVVSGSLRVALLAGDDYEVVRVVVQAGEAEVADGTQLVGAQVIDEVVVARGGDLRGASRAARGQPQRPAPVVGGREEEQAVGLTVSRCSRAGCPLRCGAGCGSGCRQSGRCDPPIRVTFLSALSSRGARAASSSITSITQRRTVVAEMRLPPAMSPSRWSWRRTARTIVAIRPRGSLRHRERTAHRSSATVRSVPAGHATVHLSATATTPR